ncbi:MAG: hypothetical protein ACOYOA_07965 [Saprospiraceae bacterium]
MSRYIRIPITFCILLFLSSSLFAQEKPDKKENISDKVHIETTDGNDFVGKIIFEDTNIIKLSTEKLGDISIKKVDISKREVYLETKKSGKDYWFPNSNSTRYLFAPNAYALKKGEGYYQNTWVFMNQVSYGFTDKFTVGLGTVPLFLFGSGIGNYTPMWITPKYTFGSQEKKNNAAVGVFYFFFPFAGISEDSPLSAGIAYGTGTIGDRNNNLSFGLGYGFGRYSENGQKKTSFAKRPTLNLSGMYRVGKRSYIVSENWLVTTGEFNAGVFTGAYRYSGKNVSVDIGLVAIATEEYTGIASPWLGILIPFSKKQSKK